MVLSRKNKKEDGLIWGVAPNKEWDFSEWQEFEAKLWKLSLKEIQKLAVAVGIKFSIGNENIDRKEEFILVMDEASKEDLLREYERIIKERK